ncbi:MAG: hypothetical protein ACRD04_06530 [Terriglobales bacterium]
MWEATITGEDPHRIVAATDGGDHTPRMSPDGRQVAFVVQELLGAYRALAVANVATGKVRLLTGSGMVNSPAWSPDGRSIYFASSRDGAVNIWKIGAGGKGLQQITSGQGDDVDLDVSADGKRIVLGSARVDMVLAELSLDAGGAAPAIRILDVDPAGWLAGPAFSPDGKRLAYFAWFKGNEHSGIGIANADGSDGVTLVQDGFFNIFPHWSRGGQSVDFLSLLGSSREARSVGINGGSPRALAEPGCFPTNHGCTKIRSESSRTLAPGESQPPPFRIAAPRREGDPAAGLWASEPKGPGRQIFHGWVLGFAALPSGAIYILQGKPDLSTVLWKTTRSGQSLTEVTTAIPELWRASYNDVWVQNFFDITPDGRTAAFMDEPVAAENLGMLQLATDRGR